MAGTRILKTVIRRNQLVRHLKTILDNFRIWMAAQIRRIKLASTRLLMISTKILEEREKLHSRIQMRKSIRKQERKKKPKKN